MKSDGGELDASVNEAQRIIALQRAAELGADYVEIELPVSLPPPVPSQTPSRIVPGARSLLSSPKY